MSRRRRNSPRQRQVRRPTDPPATVAASSDGLAGYRPPYGGAGIAALAVFALYAITLARTTQFWDASEYIATAHILGIPHPPGNPLFVVLARAWELLLAPLGLSVAVRINLFSAAMSAVAHGFWFLLAHRILVSMTGSRRIRVAGAALAVLVSATAFTAWNQSNVNEKVYTVSLLTIALLSWLAFRWRDRLGEGKDDNLLLLMVFVLALSVGNHLMAFLAAPALVLFVLLVRPRAVLNWKLYPAAVAAAIVGLSIHLYLPVRADQDPLINEADPTCESVGSALTSIVTMGRRGCEDLSAVLTRQQYDKPGVSVDPIRYELAGRYGLPIDVTPRDADLLSSQMFNYAQYFDWQWARSLAGNNGWFGGFRPFITLLFVTLGMAGAWVHARHDRISFAYVAVLFGTLSLGLTFYMNFRYGYTLPLSLMKQELLALVGGAQGAQYLREVRERDYFFMIGFGLWGVWAGIGIAALWRYAAHRLRMAGHRKIGELAAAPVLGLAILPLCLNWTWADRSYDRTARDFAYNMLMSVEPYGILFTNGDNDTFPLWYLQEVEGVRRDVTVMVTSYLNTPWYVKQIRDLTRPCEPGTDPAADPTRIICQRPFDAGASPPIYAGLLRAPDQQGTPVDDPGPGRRAPTRSILDLTDEQIEAIARTPPYALEQASSFSAADVTTVLPPGEVIVAGDAFMARMIQLAVNDRPIHFAMTTDAWQTLRLRPFLIRHGLTYRLNRGPVEPGEGIWRADEPDMDGLTGPYVDVARTDELVSSVFRHRAGFPEEWSHWVDSASEGIPYYYGTTHFALAEAYAALGDAAAAESHRVRAEAFLDLAFRREESRR